METLALASASLPDFSGMLPTRRLQLALDSCGFCQCTPGLGPQVLRITLVTAKGVRLTSGFYFEAWTEPAAGHPKNSRIHHPGQIVDLGCEHLELDWYGDEREVVLHLVEFSGSKQSRDLPVNELRVPRAAVARYAREADGHDDLRYGTRSFKLSALARQDALQRKRRFQDMLLPSSIATRLFSRLGEEQGLHIPSNEELQSLREENERLRSENSTLLTQSGMQGSGKWATLSATPAEPFVTIKFELLPRHQAGDGAVELPYRKASFQEDAFAD